MRVSYEWLKTMVDLPDDVSDLVAELVRTGTEVEAVEPVGADLDHVVTGRILSCEPHPDSDHMHVTMVDVGLRNVDGNGDPAPLQIVCGAPNVAAGEHVVVAMVGAVLPGDVKIKKSKLRGVESWGMNCSARELGLSGDHEGIMVLPDDAPVGVPAGEYLGVSDVVLDCEITPNRPDCLSMTGFAVEVGATLGEDTHIELPAVRREAGPATKDSVSVAVEDPERCSRYCARVLRGVKVGPSPEWLARRVTAAGSRPINNVVDVTNYVMYLTGQPLHAFDLAKVPVVDGRHAVVVRPARAGEHIVTLDGQDRELTPDMTVISDGNGEAIALAGVMGGGNSEVEESTCDVLLESACFSPGHTSRTSRDLGLMSEASIRYERKVDAAGCDEAAAIACALFEACCGAEVARGAVDVYPDPVKADTVALRPARVRELCGADIPTDFMVESLARLGCVVVPSRLGAYLDVVPPTSRPDLEREIDFVEEVLRLWGMGEVEPTIPGAVNHSGGLTRRQRLDKAVGEALRAGGLCETLTYNFAESGDLERLGMAEDGRGQAVRILNPLTADQGEMRRSIVPGLLRSVAYNLDHGVDDVMLYEQGRVFFGSPDAAQPAEPRYVSAVLCGAWGPDTWDSKPLPLDFFDAKGLVEELCRQLKVERLRFKAAKPERYPWLQPGRAAEVLCGKQRIGWLGNVHPSSLARFGIERDVVAFELDQDALLDHAQDQLPYRDIPTLPGVEQDLAIVVDEDMDYETCVQRIQSAGGRLLADIRLFDVYRDPVRVGPGKKSMAFALTFRAPDRTLTAADVEKAMEKLVNKISKSLGAEVRS